MPVRLTPAADAVISTKPVRMDEWADEGPLEEHIDILEFLRKDILDAARKAGRHILTHPSGKTTEEFKDEAYFRSLFNAQVKGWRLLDTTGAPIPFTPEHVAALPWDVQGWLHGEILSCGGSVPTRDLVISMGDSGQPLDYKRPDAGLVPEQTGEISDPVRDTPLR